MATTPNAARLKKLLGGTVIEVPGGTISELTSTTATIATANITTANLATVSGSFDTITNQSAVNNFSGCGDTADSVGATGESQVVGVYHGTSGRGFYHYQEEVSLIGGFNLLDNAVIAELSKTLPANAKIVEASLVNTARTDLSVCSVNILLSADAGTNKMVLVPSSTEVLGAAVGSGALQLGDSGTDGDVEASTAVVDVAGKTSVYLANDGTSNTAGTGSAGSVIVSLKYYGSATPSSD